MKGSIYKAELASLRVQHGIENATLYKWATVSTQSQTLQLRGCSVKAMRSNGGTSLMYVSVLSLMFLLQLLKGFINK